MAATTFSIVAVFVPVAFMYGVAGQWFKPFALTIACAVLVSLFVSFSLDPMLSAYWADPQVEKGARKGPISRTLSRFNRWFDRQADHYKRVIAWALDHRLAMVLLAVGSLVGALVLQGVVGGAGFVPVSDRSEMQLLVETPPSSSLEYTRRKVEEAVPPGARAPGGGVHLLHHRHAAAAALAGRGPGAGVRAAASPRASASRARRSWARCCATSWRSWAERGSPSSPAASAARSSRSSSSCEGTDARTLNLLAEQVMHEVEKVPGAVDVGLSTRGQKPELEVELRPRPRRAARGDGGAGGAVAAAGVRGAGRRATGSIPRARHAT